MILYFIMHKSENETRQHIIDKWLLESGWYVKKLSLVTEELDIWIGLPEGVAKLKDQYQDHLFTDYALLDKGRKLLKGSCERTVVISINTFYI